MSVYGKWLKQMDMNHINSLIRSQRKHFTSVFHLQNTVYTIHLYKLYHDNYIQLVWFTVIQESCSIRIRCICALQTVLTLYAAEEPLVAIKCQIIENIEKDAFAPNFFSQQYLYFSC